MIPYDGSGYGHSLYWRMQMKEIALEKGEICKCWDKTEPKINFIGDKDEFQMTIECKDKTEQCVPSFEATQLELTDKFKVFYKV
jgi:hypothetical protein